MFSIFKRLLIGKALKTEELNNEKYNVFWGLPVLSSDAISSVAYAGEEILWVLIPVIGLMAFRYMFYAALAIVFLLFILVFSYRQTIDNYPCGGGSYIVAKDNLGTIPGLVAGASLSIDYILTVAVSTSAGTAAITSAMPWLLPHKVAITLVLIAIMTMGNLRGMRESSRLFGIPTYLFIFSIIALILTGIFKIYVLGYHPAAITEIPKVTGDITLFLFLRAFASGCTALTGVEAVSNGIPNFRNPSQKNAKTVLLLLAIFVLIIFGGTSFLATMYHAVPTLDKTVISQISTQVFGNSFMYYMVQITTAVILTMAANTAFSDLPLLLSLISRDSYAPRQFTRRGKRLSFSNGIILLSLAASFLTIIFKGETHLLMPLYAIGVFISFTLSQTGMFVRWLKLRTPGWKHKAVINGIGAVITFATVIIIGITKFRHGAWIVCILIPVFVILMIITKRHYNRVAEQLTLSKDEVEKEIKAVDDFEHIIVLIDSLNKASFKAINYARHISNSYKTIVAFNSSTDEATSEKLRAKWEELNIDIPLVIKYAPYRNIMEPLIEFIESEEHASNPEDIITVVMPQFIVKHWWNNIFHGQSAIFIRQKLIHDRQIAIITIPYVLD